jgi:hypothetical protein
MNIDQEKPDYVCVMIDGNRICCHESLQHNKNFRGASILVDELMEAFSDAVNK